MNAAIRVHYTLRIAAACCFIGHGLFGIIIKEIWCNYFSVMGIGREMAYSLMPVIGVVDICMGLLLIVYPLPAFFAWLVVWGFFTAMLRPLSGEPFAECIERAGNYGAPLALLFFTGSFKNGFAKWITPINSKIFEEKNIVAGTICLQIVAFFLLAGHGCLNLLQKSSILAQYKAIGFSNKILTAHIVGLFELFAACSILLKPNRHLIFIILIWKITSELFYPQYEIVEWIERAGSYGTILALWFILKQNPAKNKFFSLQQSKFIFQKVLLLQPKK